MELSYIKLFGDSSATIDLLSDAEAGRLLKALVHYANGEEVDLPGQEKLVFAMLKAQIDRDAGSYANRVEKNRENGRKGGRPKTQQNPNNPVGFSKTEKSQDKEEDKEKDKDKEKEKDKSKVKALSRFTPPTQEEVSAYCRERGNKVDAQRFVDFYAAKGWKVGNQPMKDWKAAVRTWEQRDQQGAQRPVKTVSAQAYTQRTYSEDELLAIGDDLMAEARQQRGAP